MVFQGECLQLSLSSSSKQLENVEEDHDDVHVEDHGSNDVIINCELMSSTSNNKLSINEEVEAVEDHAESSHKWVVSLCERPNEH